jgi:20S proteasome alpha/beta subunit
MAQTGSCDVAEWDRDYLQNVVFNPNLPIGGIYDALVLVADVESDGPFAFSVQWWGSHGDPDTLYFTALGSGAQTTRTYLDAYEYYVQGDRTVEMLEALAARVMTRVAKNNIEIGGDISLISIDRDPPQGVAALREFGDADPQVRATIEVW